MRRARGSSSSSSSRGASRRRCNLFGLVLCHFCPLLLLLFRVCCGFCLSHGLALSRLTIFTLPFSSLQISSIISYCVRALLTFHSLVCLFSFLLSLTFSLGLFIMQSYLYLFSLFSFLLFYYRLNNVTITTQPFIHHPSIVGCGGVVLSRHVQILSEHLMERVCKLSKPKRRYADYMYTKIDKFWADASLR